MERIESLPRTRELRAEPAMAALAQLRARLGRGALGRGVPAARHHARDPGGCDARGRSRGASLRSRGAKPVMELLRRTLKLRNVAELSVQKQDFRLELRGREHPRALPP